MCHVHTVCAGLIVTAGTLHHRRLGYLDACKQPDTDIGSMLCAVNIHAYHFLLASKLSVFFSLLLFVLYVCVLVVSFCCACCCHVALAAHPFNYRLNQLRTFAHPIPIIVTNNSHTKVVSKTTIFANGFRAAVKMTVQQPLLDSEWKSIDATPHIALIQLKQLFLLICSSSIFAEVIVDVGAWWCLSELN